MLAASYKKNFGKRGLPSLLSDLLSHSNFTDEDGIAIGVAFFKEDNETLHKQIFNDATNFNNINRFYYLAQSDGTGSFYSLLDLNQTGDIADNPVLFFNSEGGVAIAASSLTTWLQILSTGLEISMDEPPLSFVEGECGDENDEFRLWLKNHNITPIETEKANAFLTQLIEETTNDYLDDINQILSDMYE